MDQYIYLLLALYLMPFWGIIFYKKTEERKRILKASFLGGIAAEMAEYWYYTDYWQPPTLFGNLQYTIEDFFVGFFLIGISMNWYNFIFNKKYQKAVQPNKKLFFTLFAIGVFLMLVFIKMGFNSMIISPIIFLIFTIIIVFLRQDLINKALISGILLLIIIMPVYILLFQIISSHFWQKYWLLKDTKLGITVLGNLPILEFFWYFCWGSFSSICYEFFSGKKNV